MYTVKDIDEAVGRTAGALRLLPEGATDSAITALVVELYLNATDSKQDRAAAVGASSGYIASSTSFNPKES